jgi:hypothetical protein
MHLSAKRVNQDLSRLLRKLSFTQLLARLPLVLLAEWRADLSPIFYATRISTAPRGMRRPQ